MTRVLFICGKARKRSPTAVEVARAWPGIEADCAGLSRDADEPLSPDHLSWAEVIFVMGMRQKKRLAAKFGAPRSGVNVISLDIPDRYEFMDSNLIDMLHSALSHHFGPSG